MVRVARRVWDEWRAQSQRSGKPEIDLVFVSLGASGWSADAMRTLFGRVVARFAVEPGSLGAGVDEPGVGAWRFIDVPEGVWVAVGPKAELFEPMLRALVGELEGAGGDGRVEVYEPPEVPGVGFRAELIEARVRIVGERYAGGLDRWASRIEDLDALVSAALQWCTAEVGDVAMTLQVLGYPPRIVPAAGDLVAELTGALGASRRRFAVLRNIGTDRFRVLSVRSRSGWMALIIGRPTLEDGRWERVVDELRAWILANAEHIAYARVRRGRDLLAAERDPSRIQYRAELERADDAGAYEESLVPDAYGLQLVSAELAGRLSLDSDWQTTRTADGKVLIQAANPAEWLGPAASTNDGGEGPAADVLAHGRAAFADVLFDDDARLRRRDWLDEHQTRLTLPERLIEKLSTFPAIFNVIYHVALVLDDGAIIEPCVVTEQGHVVTVDGREDFNLGGREITDVVSREQPRTSPR
jgi:hypothetical protein